MKRAGVVLVSHNSAATLDAALRSVADEDVVVIDNASDDQSVEIVRRHGNATLVELRENIGFGRACNLGMAHFAGRDVLLLNPDAELASGDVGALQQEAATLDAGVLLPELRNPDGSLQASTRSFPSLLELVGRLRGAPRDAGPVPGPVAVDWGLGAAMLLPRATLNAIGGFDPRFYLYFEDVDLCLRAWRAGLPVFRTPSMVIVHRWERASHAKWRLDRRPVRLHWASFFTYLTKHPRVALRPSASPLFGDPGR